MKKKEKEQSKKDISEKESKIIKRKPILIPSFIDTHELASALRKINFEIAKPNALAEILFEKRKKINSLIQEVLDIRNKSISAYEKVNTLGEEIDFETSEDEDDLIVDTEAGLINILELYSTDKFDECEKELQNIKKLIKSLEKKFWLSLCIYKLDQSFEKLRKSIWNIHTNKSNIKVEMDDLKEQLESKNDSKEFENFYTKEILSKFDYKIKETIRSSKATGILIIIGVIIGSGVILEWVGSNISKLINFLFTSVEIDPIIVILMIAILSVFTLEFLSILKKLIAKI